MGLPPDAHEHCCEFFTDKERQAMRRHKEMYALWTKVVAQENSMNKFEKRLDGDLCGVVDGVVTRGIFRNEQKDTEEDKAFQYICFSMEFGKAVKAVRVELEGILGRPRESDGSEDRSP